MYISLLNENPLTEKAIASLKELGMELQINKYDYLTFVVSTDKRFSAYYSKNHMDFIQHLTFAGIRVYEKSNDDNEIWIPIDCVDTIYDL